MVEIPDNYLIVFIGAVFVPMFGLLIKFIIELGRSRNIIDAMKDHIDEAKGHIKVLQDSRNDITLLNEKVRNLEHFTREIQRKLYDGGNK